MRGRLFVQHLPYDAGHARRSIIGDGHNIAPLLVAGGAKLLGGITGRFKSAAQQQGLRIAAIDEAAEHALAGEKLPGGSEHWREGEDPVQYLRNLSRGAATAAARDYAQQALDHVLGERKATAPTALEATLTKAGRFAQTEGGLAIIKGLASTGRRSLGFGRTRRRYNEYGELVPSRPRMPGGLGGAAGVSNLAKAGVAIGGLAAGYYIGTELQRALADRTLTAERAGVAAAQAFRRARTAAVRSAGRPLTPAESRSLGEQYKRGIVALGYDPVTFTRARNVAERFVGDFEEEE